MTAQIGVLNTEVAVLASDTAVSVGDSKIFGQYHKILKLADNLPVAIMVNGSGNFLSVPWARIVGLYCQEHATEKATLKDYFDSLIDYIQKKPELTNYERNFDFFRDWLYERYFYLVSKFGKEKSDRRLTTFLEFECKRLDKSNQDLIDNSKHDIISRSVGDYLENINSYAEIEHSELIKKHREKMVHYLTLLFLKQITHSPMSEIIVAGFGRNDIYPYLVKVSVEGIFENHIRMSTPVIHKIGTYYPNGNGDRRLSSVLSFAQTDGADMILGGVNREFEDFFHQNKDKNLVELLTFIEKHAIISQLEKQKQTRITSDIDHFTYRQVHNFRNELKHFKDTNYTSPIINSVRYMGVGDICELARTMVNLTSIIRRYSINQRETVGGEIDVVVLSKEEGFKEIKQKVE